MEEGKKSKELSPRAIRGIIIGFVVVLLVVVVLSIIFGLRDGGRTSTIKLLYTPTSANVKIDDEVVKSKEYKVRSGEHIVALEKEGFETQKKTVSLEENETKELMFILWSNDESTKNWYIEHEEDAKLKEFISGAALLDSANEMNEIYPATRNLPYNTSLYEIGYGVCSPEGSEICITISSQKPSGIWSVALKRFAQMDDKIGRYNYLLKGYENPFSQNGSIATADLDAASAIQSMFDSKLGTFSVRKIDYIDGYYVGLLDYLGDANPVSKDVYRVMLENSFGNWTVVAGPALVLTYNDNPEMDTEILDKANLGF